jgi:hypothetical protein
MFKIGQSSNIEARYVELSGLMPFPLEKLLSGNVALVHLAWLRSIFVCPYPNRTFAGVQEFIALIADGVSNSVGHRNFPLGLQERHTRLRFRYLGMGCLIGAGG